VIISEPDLVAPVEVNAVQQFINPEPIFDNSQHLLEAQLANPMFSLPKQSALVIDES
jgi:hypothetical protein